MDPVELGRWIGELRVRLERGEVGGLGPIDVGHGCVQPTVGLAAKAMLADLDHCDDLSLRSEAT